MLTFRTGTIIFILATLSMLLVIFLLHLSLWFLAIPFFAFSLFIAYGSSVLSANVFVSSLCKGNDQTGSIAITFDDGPVTGHTDQILAILKEYGVKATFFCIGSRVKQHPELIRKIANEGHLIGNHSYYHGNLFSLQSSEKIQNEIRKTEEEIALHTSLHTRWFRPPYGVTNPMVASAIERSGYKSIGWTVRSFDTVIKDKDKLLARATGKIKAGDIVLFHDNGQQTVAFFRFFLSQVASRGLKIVSLEDIIHEKAYR